MTIDLGQFAQYGLAGLMLAVFIWLHVRSLNRAEKAAEVASADCKERESRLLEHIKTIEAHQRDTIEPLVAESNRTRDAQTGALNNLAQAVRESRIGSGAHRTGG